MNISPDPERAPKTIFAIHLPNFAVYLKQKKETQR